MRHHYHVTGISCAGCEKKVTKALMAVPEITHVSIDRVNQTVMIDMDTHVSEETLKSALQPYPKYQLSEQKA